MLSTGTHAITLALLSAAAVFAQEPSAQPSKPAAPTFTNLQVLKDLPPSEIRPAMRAFSAALGVRCDHCHVRGNFASDEKPAKATARRMIVMARAIDANHFGGQKEVTCWTCHRGNVKPETAPLPQGEGASRGVSEGQARP